ncbi:hypothetical protein [Shewanella gelidii]|nr:hypothetical protein [Shewanella gelidii]MCL1098499.1 hypothetical protein [Shewanella gelidii]
MTKPAAESSMRPFNNLHPHYCGIDLHARLLYVCIIGSKGEVVAVYWQ